MDFTERESDIIEESMKGSIKKEIADILCIAYSTVDTHIKNAKRKTGSRNMSQLVNIYMLSKNDLLINNKAS